MSHGASSFSPPAWSINKKEDTLATSDPFLCRLGIASYTHTSLGWKALCNHLTHGSIPIGRCHDTVWNLFVNTPTWLKTSKMYSEFSSPPTDAIIRLVAWLKHGPGHVVMRRWAGRGVATDALAARCGHSPGTWEREVHGSLGGKFQGPNFWKPATRSWDGISAAASQTSALLGRAQDWARVRVYLGMACRLPGSLLLAAAQAAGHGGGRESLHGARVQEEIKPKAITEESPRPLKGTDPRRPLRFGASIPERRLAAWRRRMRDDACAPRSATPAALASAPAQPRASRLFPGVGALVAAADPSGLLGCTPQWVAPPQAVQRPSGKGEPAERSPRLRPCRASFV